MRRRLSREVPPFHNSLKSFTNGNCFHIHKLTYLEMPWTKHVSYRKEVFRSDCEFSHVLFRRQVVLEEVTSLRFFDFINSILSYTYLEGVYAMDLFLFGLDNLASVYLNDCTGNHFSPFVPVMSHTNLVA